MRTLIPLIMLAFFLLCVGRAVFAAIHGAVKMARWLGIRAVVAGVLAVMASWVILREPEAPGAAVGTPASCVTYACRVAAADSSRPGVD
jgi:hypothetical protein